MFTFTIAKFEGSSYGERYCPYDLPENQTAENMADAREKAIFAFENDGEPCERVGDDHFRTEGGDEYRVFLSD